MKILSKILWLLLFALPVTLFFSYHPVISLGANSSMNFELSLPLIWLVIFDILSFILMLILGYQQHKIRHFSAKTDQQSAKNALETTKSTAKTDQRSESIKNPAQARSFPGLSDRRFFLFALFPLYLTISVFWSPNPLRGLLTAGIVWLIFFAVFSMLYLLPLTLPPRRLRTRLLFVMFLATVLICHFCYAQSVMDVLGLSRDTTLLCRGCTYHSFGFPHPSGFAIEPQFMGNLLLAPTLTALYLVAFRPKKSTKTLLAEANRLKITAEHKILHNKIKLPTINLAKWQNLGLILLAGYFSMTLFFTFSRGAIYAYVIGILVLLIFALRRKKFRWSLITIPVISFFLSLSLQGVFTAVGPTAESFVSGITKSIHHLSLGIIDLRPQEDPNSSKSSSDCDNVVKNTTESVENSAENVENIVQNCVYPVNKIDKTVENVTGTVDKESDSHLEKPEDTTVKTAEDAAFDGYVAESTNVRLGLNSTAVKTWLNAPGHTEIYFGQNCAQHNDHCISFTPFTILFGVGLGGAGTAMHRAYPLEVTSAKEIVQHQGFSLLLESGILGLLLAAFGLLVAFFPNLFSSKFLDGRAAKGQKPPKSKASTELAKSHKIDKPLNLFLTHPALPLLLSLVVSYLITLNFFSGLPNALQIYLMPPLLYLIFSNQSHEINPAETNRSPGN